MAETIDIDIKSNIKSAAKDTDQYASSLAAAQTNVDNINQSLSIQNKVITDLEKDLITMGQELKDTPKTASAGWYQLEDAIEKTNTELKLEKVALKELTNERKDAVDEIKSQEDALKGVEDASKKGASGMGLMGKATKVVGGAFKALGLGIIIAAFVALKEALGKNQKVMDAVNAIMTTVSTTFNQVVDVLVDTYEWVTKSSDRFDGLKAVMTGLITLAMTPLKLSFFALKLGIQQAQLIWEKSIFGSGDTGTIRELEAGIRDTKDTLADIAQEAIDAGGQIVDNVGDAISEIGAIGEMAIEGLSKISVAANYESAKASVAAQNNAKLAAAELQGLIEQYDRELELTRQIRDNTALSMDERIAANEKLGTILDEQSAAMLKQQDIRIAAAQQELAQNSQNIDLQVALTEAINERAAIEATITGLRSEQLVNINALMLEQQAMEQEAFDKKVEEEQFLMDLQNENILASIENVQERALAELDIQYAKDAAELAQYENHAKLLEQLDIKYDRKRAAIEKQSAKASEKMDKLTMKGKLDVAKTTFDALGSLMGKESKGAKAAAAAGATVSALQGATSAFASLAPIPFVGPVLGGIAAAAALVAGYANVKQIYATPDATGGTGGGGGGGGGGSVPEPPPTSLQDAAAESGMPAPEMTGGAFELGSGDAPGATQAYVVTDDMTNSQDQLADIRRRASV